MCSIVSNDTTHERRYYTKTKTFERDKAKKKSFAAKIDF